MTDTARVKIQVGSYYQLEEESIWESTAERSAEVLMFSIVPMLDDSGKLTKEAKKEILVQVKKNLDWIQVKEG